MLSCAGTARNNLNLELLFTQWTCSFKSKRFPDWCAFNFETFNVATPVCRLTFNFKSFLVLFLDRRCTWRRLLNATRNRPATPQHGHSAASTDTELTTIDTHELWIQETEPTPCTMSALGQFGAEMLKLSRGLEAASTTTSVSPLVSTKQSTPKTRLVFNLIFTWKPC